MNVSLVTQDVCPLRLLMRLLSGEFDLMKKDESEIEGQVLSTEGGLNWRCAVAGAAKTARLAGA